MKEPADGWELASQIAATFGGWATVVAAVIGVGALLFAAMQVKHQSGARDFQAFIELQRSIDGALESYFTCKIDGDRLFYFGQLVATYESACYMFNHNVVGVKVQGLLKDHIIEVLSEFIRHPETLRTMKEIRSGEETYAEIVGFFRRHRKDYERHWNFLIASGWISESALSSS